MPTSSGCALFLGDSSKIFVMHIDPNMGLAISMHLQNVKKERPLTHDLIGTIFLGLGIKLEHIIINNVNDATFYSRIILSMNNELGSKIVELDSRPSDAIVLALQSDKPIYVTQDVFSKLDNASDIFNKLISNQDNKNL